MNNRKIREILEEAFKRKIIGFGTLHIGIRTLNRRENKIINKKKDWTQETALIELVEEMLK